MKTFNRTYLPESIIYNGKVYIKDANLSGCFNSKELTLNKIITMIKISGKSGIIVNVLSRNLVGKTDLYGLDYLPTKWIYISE